MAKKKTLTHIAPENSTETLCGSQRGEGVITDSSSPKTHTVCLTCVMESLRQRDEMIRIMDQMADRLNSIRTLADPRSEVDFFESKASR